MGAKKIAVIGAGLMGAGIAQVNIESGFQTIMIDQSKEFLEKGKANILKQLTRKVEKGKIEERDKEKAVDLLSLSTDFSDLKDSDVVIEAVTEDLEIKQQLFSKLNSIVQKDTILMTNTSALSVAAIGGVLEDPSRFIGFHFFYPVPIFSLVEVTPSIITSQSTIDKTLEYGKKISKETVLCKDYPGFIVNRLLIPMVNEAAYLVMEGVKPEDVDTAMKLGANHKMGPLTLADFVGIDTLVATMHGIYEGFNDSKYRPCPLLIRMVEAGTIGKKSGKGFYNYEN